MKYLALILLICLSLASCEFTPKGENFVVVPKTDTTGMSVSLTPDTDTLYLYGWAEISFTALYPNKQLNYFQALLNGTNVAQGAIGFGSFSIYTYNYADGYYTLHIELNTTSGSGSLADIRGQENMKVSRNYVVYIANGRPDPPNIILIHKIDGTLEVEWEKYKGHNFQSYRLVHYFYSNYPAGYEILWIKEITNQTSTILKDSTFIGGKMKYGLNILANGQGSDFVEKEFIEPYDLGLTWKFINKTQIEFGWRKTPYYKNFSLYTLHLSQGDDRSFDFTNVNDTVFTMDANFVFPQSRSVQVLAFANGADASHLAVVQGDTSVYYGRPFAGFYQNSIVYNAPLDKYFIAGSGIMQIVNGPGGNVELTKSLDVNVQTISANGQFLYASKGDALFRIDPANLSVINTYDLSTLNGSNNGFDWTLSVTNDNRLAAANGTGTFVLDMSNFTVVQQWSAASFRIKISPLGGYVAFNGNVLKWNSSQFVQVGTYSTANFQNLFFNGDTKLMVVNTGAIHVIDLATMNEDRSIPYFVFNVSYDPVSGLLGGVSDPNTSGLTTYYLIDPSKNTAVAQMTMTSNVVLMNNSFVVSSGILPISYYYP